MPDERSRSGRFDQPDESRTCASGDRRPHDSCAECATKALRTYRVVKRYRGDRVARDVAPSNWCDLWRLQAGDVSWPRARQG